MHAPARPLRHSRGRPRSPLSGAFPRRPGPRASSLLPGLRNGPQRSYRPARENTVTSRVGNPLGPAARLVLPPHPLRRDSTTAAATGSPAQSPQRARIPWLYYFQNLPKHLSWPCPRSRRPEAGRQEGNCVGGAARPRGRARDSPCRGGETGQHRWGGVLLGGVEGQHLGLVGDTQEARGRPRGGEGSLEAVEDLALQAMLDLAAPQHELQDFVDGVLRVFLWTGGQM